MSARRTFIDGALVIDKPAGPTSHDVVAAVRRLIGESRIGHTGTLDPMATGVLPLVLGRATRLASLLSSSDKSYDAAVRLGSATETYDASERLASGMPPPAPPAITIEEIESALGRFRGTFQQLPPPYSAKKVAGVAAYTLARRNQATELKPVEVTVKGLNIESLEEGRLRLRVTATAGFYVRSLAHDLGVALGCGAHLEALRRTRAGGFSLEQAVTLDAIQPGRDDWRHRLTPLERVADHVPAVTLTESGAERVRHGNPVGIREVASGRPPETADQVRLLDPQGHLLAIAAAGPDGLLRPSVVLV